ncbi:MAG: DUF2335 domain-containing protein [Desulfobaccales bacterium]
MAKNRKPYKPPQTTAAPPNPHPAKIAHAQLITRSAPLPPPSELEEYERVLAGSAERIFTMAESQSNHRQGLENKALSIEGRNSILGIISALIIGVVGLSIAGFCVYTGHDTAGAALGGTTLVSLVGTFIYGTRQRRIEREQKYLASTKNR